MRRPLFILSGLGLLALLASALVRAQEPKGTGTGSAGGAAPAGRTRPELPSKGFAPDAARSAVRSAPEVREERRLLQSSAAASLMGTRAAALATARSASPEVRSFAAGLLKHYEEGRPELLRLLHARGLAMPMLDDGQGRTLRRLEKLSGKGFDREFMQGVGGEALRREVRALESASLSAVDPALRAWIDHTLPGLRRQLAMAERSGVVASRAGHGGTVPPVATRVNGSNTR